MLNSKKIDSSPNNGSNLMDLMLQNGSNFSETSNARQLQSVLIQQMLYNNILDDDSIVHQFIDYLNGNFYSNSQNSDEKCTTNDCHLRLIPLHSSNSCEDNLANRNRKMKFKIDPAFFKNLLTTYNEGSDNSISLPFSNLKSKRKIFRSIGTILEKNIQIDGSNKHTVKNGLENKIRNHEKDFSSISSLDSMQTPYKLKLMDVEEQKAIATVYTNNSANNVVNIQIMPNLNLQSKPIIRNKILMQSYDHTLIIHFESEHRLSDISDGSKLPPRPPILLHSYTTRVMPNDHFISDECYSCLDCDIILTGSDSAHSLLNHVLVDHPDMDNFNGCFV